MVRRYPDCTFNSEADLAKHIVYTAILDLLVKEYASDVARARDVAEGFIREMAARVAADPRLDLDGMKQAVLGAKSVAYSDSASGVYVGTELFNRLGIADDMKAKARMIPAEPVASVVALAVVQVAGFAFFWIGGGRWRESNAIQQMFEPYGRIVVLHLTIFIATIPVIALGQPMIAVLVLALLKSSLELGLPQFQVASPALPDA